ncbi:hypothetical protein MauCBS54593_008037 [Microsporum audouinii]
MRLPLICTWLYDIVWPSITKELDESKDVVESQLDNLHTLQTNETGAISTLNSQPRTDKLEPTNTSGQFHTTQRSPFSHDPYIGLPIIGNGMTGIVLKMGERRAVKKAKKYPPGSFDDPKDIEYINKINQQTLENEIQVFERLGSYEGIIPYFQTSQYGIELALAEGDLESYLDTCAEREDSLKISWISSLIDTFAHAHSRKVFVDDIALRNILILDEKLKLADFGQSILLPPNTDITSADDDGLNVQVEILHIGWVLYSIASWRVHKYYFFNSENPDLCWPEPDSFPNVDDVLCGKVIRKCWQGEYASMENMKDEARQLLVGH